MSDAEDLEDGAAQPLLAAVGSWECKHCKPTVVNIEEDEACEKCGAKRFPGADLLDHLIRTDMPSKYLVTELIGTFFLTLVSAGTVVSSGMLSHHYGYEALSPGRALSIALASGLVRFGYRERVGERCRVGEGRGGEGREESAGRWDRRARILRGWGSWCGVYSVGGVWVEVLDGSVWFVGWLVLCAPALEHFAREGGTGSGEEATGGGRRVL